MKDTRLCGTLMNQFSCPSLWFLVLISSMFHELCQSVRKDAPEVLPDGNEQIHVLAEEMARVGEFPIRAPFGRILFLQVPERRVARPLTFVADFSLTVTKSSCPFSDPDDTLRPLAQILSMLAIVASSSRRVARAALMSAAVDREA